MERSICGLQGFNQLKAMGEWHPEMGTERKLHLVFDTETNGLPVTHAARYTELSNWPRVTQLSWGVYNDWGERMFGETSTVKPDGWTVPTTPFFVDNNMSTERCEQEGKPFKQIMDRFLNAWGKCDVVVAHNLSYDRPVIMAEMVRYGLKFPKKLEGFCTKLASEPILKLPGFKGKYKWPTLTEAHEYFFGTGFEGAHDAGADVEACAKVYFAILEYEKLKDLFE